MLYFKLNLIYPNISWSGSKICKKRDLINPQWLRNVKTKKYPIWRLDILFSKKRYMHHTRDKYNNEIVWKEFKNRSKYESKC